MTVPGFHWGAATSAYQIEGGWDADGKGPSNWDTLAHRAGGFAGGATGDVACDHYHRAGEDLDLMAGLGLTSYRFSISWPRVQPDGHGPVNPRGLAFYDRLVDGLLTRGIQPMVTLYHWDHPQAIEDKGGWLNPDTASRFADYVSAVSAALSDRVTTWVTLNEPLSVLMSHVGGVETQQGPLGRDEALALAHNLLLAHGFAAGRLRDTAAGCQVGIAVNLSGMRPASTAAADVEATARAEAYEDRLFLDPILYGRYPSVAGHPVWQGSTEDMAAIAAPIDFLGVNWYLPAHIADGPGVFDYRRVDIPRAAANMLGWPVVPDAFGVLLAWLRRTYPDLPPVYITENGQPLRDAVDASGHIGDRARIEFLTRCVAQVDAAIEAGMDIRGYYVWSLLDNLEWSHGFEPRFGLVHVDFDTLTRTPKSSYYWYRDLIRRRRGW